MPMIRKAMKGSRSAMLSLYEKNKNEIFTVSEFLLGDGNDAKTAVVQIFKNVWQEVLDGRFTNEQAFSDYLRKKTILYCHARLDRSGTRALRISQSSAYDRSEYDLSGEGEIRTRMMSQLPALTRFALIIRVLYEVARPMTDVEIAKMLGTNTATLGEVFDLEIGKCDQALRAVGLSLAVSVNGLWDHSVETVLPRETDEKITMGIEALTAP